MCRVSITKALITQIWISDVSSPIPAGFYYYILNCNRAMKFKQLLSEILMQNSNWRLIGSILQQKLGPLNWWPQTLMVMLYTNINQCKTHAIMQNKVIHSEKLEYLSLKNLKNYACGTQYRDSPDPGNPMLSHFTPGEAPWAWYHLRWYFKGVAWSAVSPSDLYLGSQYGHRSGYLVPRSLCYESRYDLIRTCEEL